MSNATLENTDRSRTMAAHPWRLLATAANFRRYATKHPAGSPERRQWLRHARAFLLCSQGISEADLLAGYRHGGAS